MNLAQVETFLVLAEELHFGRAAERLFLSQPRVSRLVASMERDIGGSLFERTSRRVMLTPLGVQLRDQLEPAYGQLVAAIEDARTAARRPEGNLRVGFTATTDGPAVSTLADRCQARYPGCEVSLLEVVEILDPYRALRRGDIDVLVNWLAVDEPDLTVGSPLEYRQRVLAVAVGHRLAERASVEDLAQEQVALLPASFRRSCTTRCCRGSRPRASRSGAPSLAARCTRFWRGWRAAR